MARTYDQFHVTISERERGTCLVKAKSKIGMAETQTKLPFAENELKEKLDRFALMAEGEAIPTENELKNFGQDLYKILFRDAVWDLFKKTTRAAEHADGLVIELDIQSPKLGRITWELLHDGKDFLALSRRTPVVRSIHPSKDETAGEVKPIELPLRIILACAKPWEKDPLNMGRQIRLVSRSVRTAMQQGLVTLHPALGEEIQPDRFRAAIRDGGYHVLHISTHGGFSEDLKRGLVLLEDGTGNAVQVAISALAGMMRDSTIQLAYLDACQTGISSTDTVSGSLSEVLVRSGVSAAIAMQFSIRDDLATAFSEAFYYHLMKGEPLCKAVAEARVVLLDLLGRETIDWAIPVLHVRRGYEFVTVGSGQRKVRFGHTDPPLRCLGRDQQLDELTEKLLTQSRLVLVHGFGGTGKSTLVQKALSEIELLFDDTCFIDCRGVRNVADVMPKICQMLAVNAYPVIEEKIRDLTESGKIRYVCEQLDKGRFLLVLDNIDDMLDDPTTRELMTHVGQFSKAKLLVTCRIHGSLIDSQRDVHLGSLETRYAIALIHEIGRDIPQIRDASDLDLRRMNEKLGGHPYSIVTAIPLFSGLPFEEVLKDLPTRVGSEDEQSQRVLSWSYSKLSPEEQGFLENISVFAGEVPLQALLDMNEGKGEDIVRGLVKKNMIEFDQVQLYSLHPLLREYAYARLGQRGDFDQIQIKAAKEVAPKCLGDFWPEALRLYQLGVDSTRRTKDHETLASILVSLGNLLLRTGEYRTAASSYKESLEISRRLGDQSGIALTLWGLAMIEEARGNHPEAVRLYNEAKATFEKLGDQSGIAGTLHQLANIEQRKGNYDEAKKLYNESLEISQKLGDQSGIATTFGQLGRLSEQKGDLEAAEKYYQQALQIFEKLGIKPYIDIAKKDLERVRKLKQKT